MARTAKRERELRKIWERRAQKEARRAALQAVRGPNWAPETPLLPKRWEDGTPESRDAIESRDRFAEHRNKLRRIAEYAGEWAGLPVGIEGEELVIAKGYKWAHVFDKPAGDDPMEGWKVVNRWWAAEKGGEIIVIEKDGKREWVRIPGVHHFDLDFSTLGCSVAWGIEQESRAVHMLGTLVKHHQFKSYMLTGMFLESSHRSGVTYCFRRLKPTVAITRQPSVVFPKLKRIEVKILACLCLHPIGYYRHSWAGAMTPTDDVVAHLMMMRGDEARYWKQANQIEPYRPEAGL